MSSSSNLEDVLGFIGLLGWSFQLAPQACAGLAALLRYCSQHRSVIADLDNIVEYSPALLLNWGVECLLLHVYVVWTELPWSLQLQPLIFMSFLLLCWVQPFLLKLVRPPAPVTKSWIQAKTPSTPLNSKITELLGLVLIIIVSFGLSDYLLLMLFKWSEAFYNSDWPRFILGIFLNLWSLMGFVPQFRDIFRSRKVNGFNFLFMDILGAFFSLGSVMVHSPFDGIAASLYAITIMLDMALVLLCIYVSKTNTYQRLRVDRDCELAALED